jgi:hypothetical protein
MSRRGTRLLAWLVVLALSLTFTAWSPAWTPAAAQSLLRSQHHPAAGTPEAPQARRTLTPTGTPTLTPTPTQLTQLQAQILLAQTYLTGRTMRAPRTSCCDPGRQPASQKRWQTQRR